MRQSRWLVLFAIFLIGGLTVQSASAEFEAGKHYFVLPEQTDAETKSVEDNAGDKSSDKIEVIEFFAYSCIHCYRFESTIKKWLKKKSKNVEFRRIHVVFNESMVPLARAYFVAEDLDVLPKVHDSIFKLIHDRKVALKQEAILAKLFEQIADVDNETFSESFHAKRIQDEILSGHEELNKWRKLTVPATPSLMVDGRFLINTKTANRLPRKMFEIVDHLVEKVSKERTPQS